MRAARTGGPTRLARKARGLAALLLDVDGVLTDGGLLYNPAGQELKRFHVHDGQGIRWLIRSGLAVGILSGRSSRAVAVRARELGITIVFQGVRDKWAVVETLMEKNGWQAGQLAYMGDDLVDLPVLERVGLAVAVPNGHPLLLRRVDYVTRKPGGEGAVRELAELLLKARGQWKDMLTRLSAG